MNNEDIRRGLLEKIADLHGVPEGAYNIRENSQLAGRQNTEYITIESKTDKSGIDIYVKDGTKNKSVHIPVIITKTGITEMVYNDFYIGDDCDVLIVAGCGIHNEGDEKSDHDGVHSFKIGKNSHVRYIEKHYGEGIGTGERIMNPTTIADLDEVHFSKWRRFRSAASIPRTAKPSSRRAKTHRSRFRNGSSRTASRMW